METTLLINTVILFTIIGLCLLISSKLGASSIIGFIVAGILLGPNTPGIVASHNIELLQSIADFGVLLFLFILGLELQPQQLWSMRKDLTIQGGGQVIFTGMIFMGLAYMLGQPWELGLLLGLILAQSSTAVVISLLSERRELNSMHGKNIFANLMGQDISIVFVMLAIPLLAHYSTESEVSVFEKGLYFSGTIAFILFLARIILPRIFVWCAKNKSREIFIVTVVCAIFSTIIVVDKSGMPETLGIFILGMLLSNCEFKYTLEEIIMPIKGTLMALFFIAIGMSIDPQTIVSSPFLIASILTLTFIIKILVFFFLSYTCTGSKVVATKTAFALAQVGELGFVLFGVAHTFEILDSTSVAVGFVIIIISMIATPWVYQLGNRLSDYMLHHRDSDNQLEKQKNNLIVVGLDEVGRLVCIMAEKAGISYVGYDLDYERVVYSKSININAQFGDILSTTTQKHAGLDKAKTIFLSVTDSYRLKRLSKILCRYNEIAIYASTSSNKDQKLLEALGIHASSIYIESTLNKGQEVLIDMGLSKESASRVASETKAELNS